MASVELALLFPKMTVVQEKEGLKDKSFLSISMRRILHVVRRWVQ
jgi:hypothetical protein